MDTCGFAFGCLGSNGGGAVNGGGGGTNPSPGEEGEGFEAAKTLPITFTEPCALWRGRQFQAIADWLIAHDRHIGRKNSGNWGGLFFSQ